MITIISPAKKLDFSAETTYTETFSQPDFLDQSQELVNILSDKSPQELSDLMSISSNLAELNYERYQEFSTPFELGKAKQALLAFKGDVYQSLTLEEYNADDYSFAQAHLRILSGLYGLLKPMDLIQPYRLEMGTKLKNKRGKNLYEFWGDRIANSINEAMEVAGTDILLNLASNEYFKSVNKKLITGTIITPSFKDDRNGTYKTIFLYAKQARGAMSDYVIREKITNPEGLKGFNGMGYSFNDEMSSGNQWVFTR